MTYASKATFDACASIAEPVRENETLKDAAGLGVVIMMIAASQMWSFMFG